MISHGLRGLSLRNYMLVSKLIDLFIDATNYAQIVTRKNNRKKSEKVIYPTQEICDFIERNEDVAALLEPVYLPMVVPPELWTSPTGLSNSLHEPLVSRKNNEPSLAFEELEDMTEEMAEVYAAINHIHPENTVDGQHVHSCCVSYGICKRGLNVAGLPSREDIPVPRSGLPLDRKSKDLTEDEKVKFKAWKESNSCV